MLALIVILRLLAPLLILRWPLTGVAASMALDAYDYQIIGSSFIGYHNYQVVDKLLDTYFLLIMGLTVRKWADARAKKIAYALIGWRLIGVIIFIGTGLEYVLFFFPNLFLDFYLFYALYTRWSRQSTLITSPAVAAAILVTMAIPKLVSEYTLHVSRLAGVSVPDWLQRFIALPQLSQMLLMALPSLTLLGYYVIVRRQPKADQLKIKSMGKPVS
ncbi:hypothetical protein EPO04_01295 [Patescibacteria group bacterium]|nr:MAG: hypothetical protein EPO04_01295 [Patescibacteria group bacterium]